MRLLLDTAPFLWWLGYDETLDNSARLAIERPANSVYVSAATLWEIAIKQAVGKLRCEADLIEVLRTSRFFSLDISPAHAVAAGTLPLHHKDPFDRMLIAQAEEEKLVVVTRDPLFRLYGVRILPA